MSNKKKVVKMNKQATPPERNYVIPASMMVQIVELVNNQKFGEIAPLAGPLSMLLQEQNQEYDRKMNENKGDE